MLTYKECDLPDEHSSQVLQDQVASHVGDVSPFVTRQMHQW